MELGNNFIVHTQQMHRHTVLKNIVYIVWFVASIIPFSSHILFYFHCKTMFTTNFSFAICISNRFYLVWKCFLSNDFFFSLSRFSLLIIVAFCTRLYMNLSSEYHFPLSFENDKKHIHSICLFLFSSHNKHTHTFFVGVCAATAPDNFSIHICELLQCEWKRVSTLCKTFYAYTQTFSLTHWVPFIFTVNISLAHIFCYVISSMYRLTLFSDLFSFFSLYICVLHLF